MAVPLDCHVRCIAHPPPLKVSVFEVKTLWLIWKVGTSFAGMHLSLLLGYDTGGNDLHLLMRGTNLKNIQNIAPMPTSQIDTEAANEISRTSEASTIPRNKGVRASIDFP
ncbi:MAG: hypothetical protein V4805_19210 [Pseudomonadota bacterium]